MIIDKIEKKKVNAVIFTTNGLEIKGGVFLHVGLDLIGELNAAHKKFYAVSNAQISTLYGDIEVKYEQKILILNKDEIVCALLLENDTATDEIEEKKNNAVIFTTNGLKIEGKVLFPPAIRLIDELNAERREFFLVKNADIYTSYKDINAKYEQKTLLLNKGQIVHAYPLE